MYGRREITYTCTAGDDTYTETLAATGYSYEAVVTEPTCTEGGNTTYTCSVCGDSYVDNHMDVTDHDRDGNVCVECDACRQGKIKHSGYKPGMQFSLRPGGIVENAILGR